MARKSTKGRKLSPEHLANVRAAAKRRKPGDRKIGWKLSEETKAKMSKAKAGLKHTEEHTAKRLASYKETMKRKKENASIKETDGNNNQV